MGFNRRIVLTAVAAAVGWGVGWTVAALVQVIPRTSSAPFLEERAFLPHHVPKYAGGVSFRFAMVHDVIHERFAKHGSAYYRERDRITREALRKLTPGDPASFVLTDDLGVGLDRLGRSDEAAAVMREKLAIQQAKGLSGRDLYTSYADLGTFLIHGSAKKAASGDATARERFREGLAFVRKSIEVNPEAHFGREQWQAAIAEFLLAAMDDPALLRTFDCLGHRLDLPVENVLHFEALRATGYSRPYDYKFNKDGWDDVPEFFLPGVPLDAPSRWPVLSPIRQHITRVGAERGWEDVAVPSHRSPVPFDEPMLGIIGMWRQGGGANPHFALALGETMLRVGQRYIAWAAFERASRLADRYSTNPETQAFLRGHCEKRQGDIEESLATDRLMASGAKGLVSSRDIRAELRSQFEAELAYGEGFQRAYQEFEASRIATGASIRDEHFFDDFPRRQEAIASRSGSEEWLARISQAKLARYRVSQRNAWAILGAGLTAMATGLLLGMRSRPRSSPGPGLPLRHTVA